MATEQELASAKDRISQLERLESERAKAAGVVRELAKYELVSGTAAQQLCDLIAPTVQITPVGGGRQLIHGQDFKPLEAVVAERMRSPDHSHFLKGTQSHAAASPAACRGRGAGRAFRRRGNCRPA